jgi:hypothetical protein
MQRRVIARNTDGKNDGRDDSGNHSSGHRLRTKLSWDLCEKENFGMGKKNEIQEIAEEIILAEYRVFDKSKRNRFPSIQN